MPCQIAFAHLLGDYTEQLIRIGVAWFCGYDLLIQLRCSANIAGAMGIEGYLQ